MSKVDPSSILEEVGNYYTGKLIEHGPTPRGADWRDVTGQERRFDQLLRIVGADKPFSLGEIGCGYGALATYLKSREYRFDYIGCDISEPMITAARDLHADQANIAFTTGSDIGEIVDYVVASGIFNVRFEHDDDMWFEYVSSTIDGMVRRARNAVSFNMLTGFSDEDRKERRLWYPNPGQILNHCLSRYGFRVSLFHDYEMYEFTVAIRNLPENSP